MVIQLPRHIGLALLLNRKMHGRRLLRLVVFAPYVLSEAITAVIWLLMLQPGGFVDQVLGAVGLGGLVHLWLAGTTIVLYTLFVVATWKYIGFGIILLLAGLQGIPEELREAAALDGATSWQATRHIDAAAARADDPNLDLPVGDRLAPVVRHGVDHDARRSRPGASSTMVTYLIDHGFKRNEFGYGSAVAVLLFVICFVFALLYQRFALRRDTDGALTRPVG